MGTDKQNSSEALVTIPAISAPRTTGLQLAAAAAAAPTQVGQAAPPPPCPAPPHRTPMLASAGQLPCPWARRRLCPAATGASLGRQAGARAE
jgi:hypothetical protein